MRYLLTGDIRHPGKIEVEAATLQALDRADDGDFEVSDEQGKPLAFDWGGIAEDDHGNDVSDQASIPAEPQREVWYAWKERREVDGRMRLLTPWSNPEQHEHPFDLLFATPEAARVAREEYEADDEPWVLVRVTYQVSAAAGTLEGAWLHNATGEQIGALSDVSVREGRVPDELANALLVMVLTASTGRGSPSMTRRRCGKPRRRCVPPATRTGCHDRGRAARAGHPVVAAELPGGTSMAMSSFNELAEHVGHDVAVVTYGQRGPEVAAADNVAVECVTCAAVLLDFDNTDTPDAPPYKLAEATLSVQPPLAEAQFRRLEELIGRQPERFKDWAPSFHFALPLTTDPNSSPAVAYAREQALPHQLEIVSYWP